MLAPIPRRHALALFVLFAVVSAPVAASPRATIDNQVQSDEAPDAIAEPEPQLEFDTGNESTSTEAPHHRVRPKQAALDPSEDARDQPVPDDDTKDEPVRVQRKTRSFPVADFVIASFGATLGAGAPLVAAFFLFGSQVGTFGSAAVLAVSLTAPAVFAMLFLLTTDATGGEMVAEAAGVAVGATIGAAAIGGALVAVTIALTYSGLGPGGGFFVIFLVPLVGTIGVAAGGAVGATAGLLSTRLLTTVFVE